MSTARLIFAISGASGLPVAESLLQAFSEIPALELHLIISANAEKVLEYECKEALHANYQKLKSYAKASYEPNDLGAAPASGSWPCQGMLICPCSMASLAAIAHGFSQNLLQRAADVTLKERRPLILVPRESPLNRIHLQNLLLAHDAGATIMPFMPAYYLKQTSPKSQLQHFAGRVLEQFGLPNNLASHWGEDK